MHLSSEQPERVDEYSKSSHISTVEPPIKGHLISQPVINVSKKKMQKIEIIVNETSIKRPPPSWGRGHLLAILTKILYCSPVTSI